MLTQTIYKPYILRKTPLAVAKGSINGRHKYENKQDTSTVSV